MTAPAPADHRSRRIGTGRRIGSGIGAAAALFGLGIASCVLLPLVIVSTALIAVWVGIPMLALVLMLLRSVSMGQRRIVGMITGQPMPAPYRAHGTGFANRVRVRISDPATYRDVIWLPFAIMLGLPLGITALVLFLIFPVGIWLSPLMLRTYAGLAGMVLRRAETEEMARRIAVLAQTRADTVDIQNAELRRIERDLHDGAQARLVALSMNLGLAEQLLRDDPESSKDLIAESRASAAVALSDLRSLVRGIHPPVLADRGLVGAVQALALGYPGDVEVDVALDGHPPGPVESAMYFAIAEALTNAVKHSNAQRIWVWGRYQDGRLRVSVGDDGVGGAVQRAEGGLTGIGRRLAAFDGSVAVASPPGAGTIVSLEVPCELSSVRT
jgi:signal transduction histidine kinase